ncbi:hypothetical protein GOODEAATRI_024060 [Goodea atripinnis]|uniref:ATP synthase F0 subunit 8 n=1 Tax=Goodea atripinnis TaxID=208336 RepID=A0ABV0PGM9_9TELE
MMMDPGVWMMMNGIMMKKKLCDDVNVVYSSGQEPQIWLGQSDIMLACIIVLSVFFMYFWLMLKCGIYSLRQKEFTNRSLDLVPGGSIEEKMDRYLMVRSRSHYAASSSNQFFFCDKLT